MENWVAIFVWNLIPGSVKLSFPRSLFHIDKAFWKPAFEFLDGSLDFQRLPHLKKLFGERWGLKPLEATSAQIVWANESEGGTHACPLPHLQ